MKINKLFLLAMGLVAVGCNDSQIEEQSLINNAQGEAVEVELSATIAPASRATSNVGEYDGVTAVDLQFEVGDHIGVYLNNEAIGFTHENTDFEYTQNADGTPKFVPQQQMILLGSGNNVYAYYPFEATDAGFEGTVTRSANRGTWDGYHYFEIPAVQQQDTIEVDGVKNPFQNLSKYVKLISKETQMYKVGNTMKADMVFYHAFAYVTMNVQNTYADKDINIVEATVKLLDKEGNAMPIVGDFAAALDNEGNELMVKASDYEGASQGTVATVNSTDASGCVLTLDPEQSAYITAAVAPAACDGYEVRLVTDKGFVYKVRKTGLGEAFAVGQGVNRKLSIPVSDETLSSEVTNSEVAEYMLHMDKEHIVLDLAADIELNINASSDDAWGGANTKTITINGSRIQAAHGENITSVKFNLNKEDKFNDVDLVNPNATLYFNNVQVKTNGGQAAGYEWHNLVFNCKVNMTSATVWSSMTARRSIDLTNVTIFDWGQTSTWNYALWLQPTVEEQKVNLTNLAILPILQPSRGIKIDAVHNYDAELGEPQKVTLNIEGKANAVEGSNVYTCELQTAKKAAILVCTKVGADITVGENVNIAGVADDTVNHIWVDEEAKTTEDVEKLTIKNARWKLEGATWSAENDANGAVVTAYADDDAGMDEAFDYGMNTIVLADGTYTLPDMSARQISLSGGVGAKISVADNHTHLTDCTVTLNGVTLSATNADYGIKKATALSCSGVTVKPIALYGQQAMFVGCTFDLTTENGSGNYVRVKEVNTADFTKCVFNTNGKAILISNTDEASDYASNVTVKESQFYALGDKPAYTNGNLKTQACAAIEISNTHKNEVGAAHKLTTSGNTVGAAFSGEWRIKSYQEGAAVTVNGTEYTQIALDGKKMEVTDNGIIFVD